MRFRVQNFRSLKEEQELSMVAGSLTDSSEAVTQVEGLNLGLLRAAAIYGANASGKTNVLKALAYMRGAVLNSQRQWPPEGPIPRNPFLLDAQSKSAGSFFEADVLTDGTRYSYGFVLNDHEIVREWLNAYPTSKRPNRKQMWFRRERRAFTFGKKLTGDNQAIERLTRPNSLFLSAAAQNNHEALLPIYRWFAERLTCLSRERHSLRQQTAEMCQDSRHKPLVLRMLKAADLGIIGLSVDEVDLFALPPGLDADQKAVAEEFFASLRKFVGRLSEEDERTLKSWEKRQALSLIHRSSSEAGVLLGEENESDGTLAFFGLLGPVLRALSSGGTICVDELDSSLHPLLVLEVVRLFNDPKLNPSAAQIIFTTHDTNVLDRSSLRRDQVWFTEKDDQGGTHLYPLTDFTTRKNENLERGYLQGRYGAIPFVGSTDLFSDTKQEGATE
ncbi:MAG TPA: ATP-binding protein [Terriglobia bacterium]|nr:ATP-binding protein [Terriglobia bacterium]